MFELPRRVLFGAAYYHEYQPYDRLKTDLDLMAEARFTVIRVGESVWSTWEPENGRFDLDWLQPVLDGAHERGISVILGTPTYAVPPWLARQYPEIAGERAHRASASAGAPGRRSTSPTRPSGSTPSGSSAQIVARYAGHPAVIGFQVDNEPGYELLPQPRRLPAVRRPPARARTATWRRSTANGAWSTGRTGCPPGPTCGRPDGNAQPQYDLAWRRFQAELDHRVHRLAGRHRPRVRPRRTSSSPPASPTTGPAVDDDELTERARRHRGQPVLRHAGRASTLPDATRRRASTGRPPATWALYQQRRPDVLLPPGAVPGHRDQRPVHRLRRGTTGPAYDGQWRQAAWALVSRGAAMIEYWHWHTLHFGAETYWGGVLPHSGRPGPHLPRSWPRLGAELEPAGDARRRRSTPDADVAMVYSTPSKWLMQKYPPLATADGGPDAAAYHGIFDPFYRGAFDAGLQVRIVHAGSCTTRAASGPARRRRPRDASGPGRPGAVRRRRRDARLARAPTPTAGGHLVLGPRTGYADHEARARTEPAPGRLVEAAGVRYDEFSNLVRDVPVRAAGRRRSTCRPDARRPAGSTACTVEGAEVLAEYDAPALRPLARGHHPPPRRGPDHLRRHRARRRLRPGPVRRYGPADSVWRPAHPSVTVTSATARDGRRVRFLHNWSWDEVSVPVPAAVRDVLSETVYGDTVPLGPWDVKVLQDEAP